MEHADTDKSSRRLFLEQHNAICSTPLRHLTKPSIASRAALTSNVRLKILPSVFFVAWCRFPVNIADARDTGVDETFLNKVMVASCDVSSEKMQYMTKKCESKKGGDIYCHNFEPDMHYQATL
ncbi:hypothetical protein G9A89_008547 [Geosiphon pyriformis]|nr:hypothetical protein G9A89_008547 [Geosiphon pyriformis]